MEISNQKDICTICGNPFKHKRYNIQLLDDPLPVVRIITCHAKCDKQRRYENTKKLVREFFLEKGVRILDLEEGS